MADFAYDFRPIRKFADRDHKNIASWTEFGRGSHWSSHDVPDLVLTSLRDFFRTVRQD
ncbi:hypothetical protein ITI46_30345 [Streptomyces oryzae]|uniref:Epoxide hydrolase n=1 Tax=Streptomyces oryzae TaxID=1434886 RepID=A0ABS3XKI2_9ACTN|nr:hypothetical protein [Streptomyces oryzae]MBO8195915.1 hypothetical protein [Streptomyces oryzae]